MNTEIKKVQEDIDSAIDTITLNIPARIDATIVNNASFEFTISIDEIGQIVITPATKDVMFTNVKTHVDNDNELPIMEQETIKTETEEVTNIQTSINIKAHLLAEVENHDVSAVIDDNGRIVITPVAVENSFVTASYDDSLNLITENLTTVDYFGYRIVNNKGHWDIYDYQDTLIGQNISTLAEAKIAACMNEIHLLENLVESVESESTKDVPNDEITDIPDVQAEVIDESLTPESTYEIIARFMRGEIALFSDTGEPLPEYVHLSDLDSNGYSYYYDASTDAIVSYPSVR